MLELQEFSTSRNFNVRKYLVYRAWTDAAELEQWWGPKASTLKVLKLELRQGGLFHFCMKASDGSESWGKFVFNEVIPGETLSFIASFSDASGNTVRNPVNDIWPLEVLNTVLFSEREGNTVLKISGKPLHATDEECMAFYNASEYLKEEFDSSFERLEVLLSKTGV
ncbi:MAG: SRPBCC domain-containing protein [Lentimicrobiaceae bacterium]|nr:SRPBCC domain-containing protein [Lentimicrobiaceae bacterium]MCB9024150.1 SRPBCC domain-containing protein [Lentimicrobiaceae bacterium]MCO5264934.1 SRPBCC domain-containing protein [Lentimicrobium sp.]HPG33461.1 SRPBCC domain-containing protein [Lentimicrobium sp.]